MASPDYYSDGSDSADMEVAETDKPTENDNGAATALLPKNFFPGDKPLEPGNVCKVKIARVLDDQVEITYVKKYEEDDEEMKVPEEDEVAEMME